MPLNPSPQRQTLVTFPTPNVNDILFFESIDAERVGHDVPAYGTKHPNYDKWPNHRLVHVESSDEQGRYYRYYYAADHLEQDDDNWAFTQADIGGTKFDAVAREYVTRRTEYDPGAMAMGDAMPDTPASKFSGTYILAERKQIPINDKVLNGLYITEQRVYVKRTTMCRLDYDEFFSTTNYTKQDLFYAAEIPAGGGGLTMAALVADPANAYWGLGADGILRVVQQLSDSWYAVTEQQVVNTTGGGAGFTHQTAINYSFPPILSGIAVDGWELRSGGFRNFPRPQYLRGAYRGPCRATVTVTWSSTVTAIGPPDDLPRPETISIASPFFSTNIPPTLHEQVIFSVANGSNDETYKATVGTYTAAATNITDWTGQSYVVSKTQKPFRGGWLIESTTVHAPT